MNLPLKIDSLKASVVWGAILATALAGVIVYSASQGMTTSPLSETNTKASPTTEADAVPTQETLPELAGTTWVWQRTEMNDDSTTQPQNDEFVLSFKADGTLQSLTDCNTINGGYGYNAATGQITIENLFQTKMLCPESLEETYVSQLQSVTNVLMRESTLYLQLPYDGGSMIFVKSK